MPHQCVHCGKIIDVASKEILEGCGSCGSKFFFYIKEDQINRIRQLQGKESAQEVAIPEFNNVDKKQVEKDVREILDVQDDEKPVILDVESVRVIQPGKFEIDLVSLINRRPIIFKIQEGKYIIDLEGGLGKFNKKN